MSGVGSYVSDVLFGNSSRGIFNMIPDVVIDEQHTDMLEITDHPVDRLGIITDNSYVKPSPLTLHYGWSPGAPAIGGLLGTVLPISKGLVNGIEQVFGDAGDYLTTVYADLRKLQAARQPVRITTGKRVYENMLIQQLSFSTSRETEYSLIVTIVCREIQLVDVLTTNVAPQAAQANPQQTAAVTNAGTQQPTAVATPRVSALSRVGSYFGFK